MSGLTDIYTDWDGASLLDGSYLDDGDAGEQQQQGNPLDSGQRLPEHQDAEERRGEDL